MLELRGVSFSLPKEEVNLLQEISFRAPRSHFMAIVGPSGCGKTTLLKIIAGILEESAGTVHWDEKNLATEAGIEPQDIGYVPQFSVAYDHLSVEENVDCALRLRVDTANRKEAEAIADSVIGQVGLSEIADRRAKVLSGGERRRLGLAQELVSNPSLLLCDEVTSGLDPRGERDIVYRLRQLAKSENRVVINVTHSLSNLEAYDSVLAIHEGRVAYHGPPRALAHYFSAKSAEDIYTTLAEREGSRWHQSWRKHRESYYRSMRMEPPADGAITSTDDSSPLGLPSEESSETAEEITTTEIAAVDTGSDKQQPGMWAQVSVLLSRRLRIFFRDRTQLALHLAIVLGFPLLVVLFTPGFLETDKGMGVPPMPTQLNFSDIKTQADLARQGQIVGQQFQLGILISALIMLQVILLAIMGSNNSAREVVGERAIFEKEKLAGLSPFAYVMSKFLFLALLCLAQSAWMALFVNHFTNLPGDFSGQFTLLFLLNAAITAVSLAFSSWMRSTEQASLLSIYLVGFQLPLSGAILSLPDKLEGWIRPLVAAYWSWAGQVYNVRASTDYEPGITQAVKTTLANSSTCVSVLLVHIGLGLFMAYQGSRRDQWD